MAILFRLILVFVIYALVNAESSEYGFIFSMYEGRRGEILSLDCVTDTATLTKFSHINLQGIRREFYYSATPTILHNYKYLLHKQSYSKLLHVYSMIITKLDYSDEGEYYCHFSDGRMSYSNVYVLGTNSEWHNVFFTQPDYVVSKNSYALLSCLRPLGQKFDRFYFRKDMRGKKRVIQHGVEGYEIEQDSKYNSTRLKFFLSDNSKTGLYECQADGESTPTKVSMKCDIPDVSIQNIVVRKGTNGHLKVNWIGEMMQKFMLTSWERVQTNEDISIWRYDNENELAVRLNRKFYATISNKYQINEDGTLIIKAAKKKDAGYYKFRLVCGKGFVKGLLVNFVVVD